MRIIYYPEGSESTGPVRKLIKQLKKNRPDLFALTQSTLQRVERELDLESLISQEQVAPIHSKKPIYEFRIPPKKPGGVVRLYFCYKKDDPNTIVILSGELKKRTRSDPEKINQAKQRYEEASK